ncbi:decd3916-e42c-4117-9874-0aa30fe61f9b [Thermothielavioides terrestris]|uniref:ESCRT-II complex subunit VPS25 n=1 Tax=Thermothielavioides terrestris TaxID=2587410 RepID=A0A3S4BRA2_9PEZI|nr:decd3916-e42c-4117-9874-0aa30fe61f9b [Thermothielavioides terrestris]
MSTFIFFPPEYSFPPFFTRQTNLTTHHAQLVKWSTLVLAYCRHHRIFKLSLSGSSTSSSSTATAAGTETAAPGPGPGTGTGPGTGSTTNPSLDTSELFYNRRINRRLSLADIREVIDFLRRDGRAEYVAGGGSSSSNGSGGGFDGAGGGGGGGGEGDVAWIYWRTPEEWAALVEGWVDATGQRGSVLTLYELVEGDGTRGKFHGLDQELLLKALNVLVKRGKAQVFGQEDSRGVKFF